MPISIIDYFKLTSNEDVEKNNYSSVVNLSFDDLPKFLKTGDRVAKKNNSFLNLSNVISPNNKLKININTILNFSTQLEIIETQQKYINSNLSVSENSTLNEKNLFGIFDLKNVYKPNANTIFKINNYGLINNLNSYDETNSNLNNNYSSINQSNNGQSKKNENNFSFLKKFDSSSLSLSTFLNFEEIKKENDIKSTSPFLDIVFSNNNYFFNQYFTKNKINIGIESIYNLKLKKSTVFFKGTFQNSKYKFENKSDSNLNYGNKYKSDLDLFIPEIGTNFNLSKKYNILFSVNYNLANQNINSIDNYKSNYVGFNFNNRYLFNYNSVLQINYSYSNNLSNSENLIENEYVKDYRTLIKNKNLFPNTLFPSNKISISYINTNAITNNVLIINLNTTLSNKVESTNIKNEINYSISENAINSKNDSSAFDVYLEHRIKNFPLSVSFSSELKYEYSTFFIDNSPSFFKLFYNSYSLSFKSKFKKSPINFDINTSLSNSNFNNNTSLSNNKNIQLFLNTNGLIFKSLFWNAFYGLNYYNVNTSSSTINELTLGLRYSSQKSKWEYKINANNILNFNNPVYKTNKSSAGLDIQSTILNLAGYINVGLKYKF